MPWCLGARASTYYSLPASAMQREIRWPAAVEVSNLASSGNSSMPTLTGRQCSQGNGRSSCGSRRVVILGGTLRNARSR